MLNQVVDIEIRIFLDMSQTTSECGLSDQLNASSILSTCDQITQDLS